ncbi:MAG: aminotransferase class I/II-fold pyridoxal phosphate-dependent enzyme [Rhodobacteraceae bacterium]|nr:aminotransferase class I/II-fold pyridoxal phosphate-dependent enzyme [Paracoccaceae bacterium]
MIRPNPHIAARKPYALANMGAADGAPLISLAQNESLRSPSPKAIAAAAWASESLAFYPDPDWLTLRAGLSELHGLPRDSILCGAGSLDLIGALARVYAGSSRAVLTPAHAYPFFRTAAQMACARFDTAVEEGGRVSVDALLSAVRPDTGIVFVANPGNPTGTRLSRVELLCLREGLRGDILLVIDEAYGEFADHLDARCFDMVVRGDTVVLRTFSKAYGLAGARVGWGTCPPEIATELRKVLNPNNISATSQAAAAAALADQAYMQETCRLTMAIGREAAERLRKVGVSVADSYTNFLLLEFDTSEQAKAIEDALRAKGVILRRQAGAGLPHALRMTLGPAPWVDQALDLLVALTQEAKR